MMKKWLALMGLVTVCLLPVAAHAETADQMVRQTSREVLDIIKKENGKNTARIRAEVEAAAVPKFDFTRMTALATGRGWRQASPEQQAQLTEQFLQDESITRRLQYGWRNGLYRCRYFSRHLVSS